MHQAFDITRTSRKVLSSFLQDYTLEQLNKTPSGFSNNLIWNIGHIVVVQQILTYKLSGLSMHIPDSFVEEYKRGTRPEQDATQAEVDEILSYLFQTINQTKTDYNAQAFKNYQEFTSQVGFTMRTIEDAISFNYYHEALHLGIMMQIRKLI